jgi:hypothetical protein
MTKSQIELALASMKEKLLPASLQEAIAHLRASRSDYYPCELSFHGGLVTFVYSANGQKDSLTFEGT